MSRGGSAEEVSNRLLMQLRNKGYQRIELATFTEDGGHVRRQQVSWTPHGGKHVQTEGQSSGNPRAPPPGEPDGEGAQGGAAH